MFRNNTRFVAVVVCLLACGCAQESSPVAPGSVSSGAGGARTERKVGDPAGVLVCDSVNPCTALTGVVRFSGPSLTFTAGTLGQMDASDPSWYSARTMFAVQPSGRLQDSTISLVLTVDSSQAHLTVFLQPPNEAEVRIAGIAVPQFSDVADSSCASGQRLDTQFVVNLEKFGRTQVTHGHCR